MDDSDYQQETESDISSISTSADTEQLYNDFNELSLSPGPSFCKVNKTVLVTLVNDVVGTVSVGV